MRPRRATAAVFVASDSALAYNKFRAPLPHGHLIVMLTYYVAQTLLTLSVEGVGI